MADFTAIAEVTDTLVGVLQAGLQGTGIDVERHDLQGQIPTAPPRLTLFLFQVREDGHARNTPPSVVVAPNGVATIRRPPLALVAHFLVTPWAGTRQAEQQILGRAVRILHDNSIIAGPQLTGTLGASNEALHVRMTPLTIEEQTRVWYSLQRPYHVSLHYEVRVVRIESLATATRSTVRVRGTTPADPGSAEVR